MTSARKTGQAVIKQNDEAPVPVEVLAESIKAISAGVKRLRNGKLKDDALFLLIQHAAPTVPKGHGRASTKPTIREIKAVLAGMESLEAAYLKKASSK